MGAEGAVASLFFSSGTRVWREVAPGGVLRYISYGDVRSPFLGLKFAI